jgi:hypothetical protein
MRTLVAAVPAFLASVVEFVEALTIVLAVGVTRQWRSTLIGVGAAVLALAVIVGVFGTAIVLFVPIEILRLVVGGFLLVFGLQWICKAVLRAAGARAKHDEAAIYEHQLDFLSQEPPVPAVGMDWSCSKAWRSPSSSSPSGPRSVSWVRPRSARSSPACLSFPWASRSTGRSPACRRTG